MSTGRIGKSVTPYRWIVCALLFFATTTIYVDRQVFGILGPQLTKDFGWTEKQFSYIVTAFTLAYAIGYAAGGRMMDRIGVRKGFAAAIGLWSAAALAHGLIGPLVHSGLPWLNAALAGTLLGSLTPAALSVAGFSVVRFVLGLSEGGNFPAAIKTVGQWFPKSERALAIGIFNCGSNVGNVIAICAVPFIVGTMQLGWAAAFYMTGAMGFLFVALWSTLYRNPHVPAAPSAAEATCTCDGPPERPVEISWLGLLQRRQTWAYVAGTFLTSPVWWFYLYWLPKFLKNNFHVDLGGFFWPLFVVYLMADAGSIGGGGLSSWLIRRGVSVNAARKTAFLACALGAVPVVCVARVTNKWLAVCLVGLAAACHQGFSANLYAIVTDTVPSKVVSSVVGIGGTAGCIGMVAFSTLIGCLLDWTEHAYGTQDYLIPFMIAGSAYLAATAVIHLLLPRLEPMTCDTTASAARENSLHA
jgi:ACS family hexuronate transporter-like MFS transporter